MTHEPRPTAAPDTAAYRQALITALRLKDVPGDRIGELVAEVESHVADTGEDPVEAFGPAAAYAASLTDEHRPDPWWHTAALVVGSMISGWLLAQGALSWLLGETYLGRPGWVWVLVGLVVAVPAALRVRARSSRVRDPRTGSDLVPTPWWAPLLLVALPVGVVVVAYGAIRIWG